ncbi:MAG: arsenite efflux transporter metallochaperone ArsD [Candidatus Dormiibacterota bacterium]
MRVEVYDPAMCCSTGVCGPKVDPGLARFASDLDWLSGQGVQVTRFNLSQEPGAFVANPVVSELLQLSGELALPTVMVEGEVRSSGRFPGRSELAAWTGLTDPGAAVEPRVPLAMASTASSCCGGDDSQSTCC